MTSLALPEGIVTLLFTDIEGSTQLLNRLGDSYASVLMRHRELIDEAIATHEGVVVRTEGDAFFAVFQKASTAVAAAVAAQRALAEEPWPLNSPLRVRMGLHSGEVDVVRGDYVGLSVHVAARVSAAANGGQILITEATAELAGNPDTSDLGRHLLKDVGDFGLLQVRAPGLSETFPALRSLSTPNNIPSPVDSFVGRQAEMSEVAKAIGANRLVTLTGAGGSGKTVLALETAFSVMAEFPDGVWLVPLATVDVGDRVVDAVAQALHVSDRPGEAISDTLNDWLQGRHALLVLDNCEHVVEPVAVFCERFLSSCSNLHLLATSREVLGARGEHAIRTPPLAVPENLAVALHSDAVQLFVERATAAVPTLAMDEVDLAVVVRVCRRLDGLPLAIELAAARLRSLSLTQLESRLGDRFRLLTGKRHAAVPRQQTLQAVVGWSYDLLDDLEKLVFSRLAVFPDHFTLDMAEAVASDPLVDEGDVVDILSRLVDKSLVTTVSAPDGLRFTLLETLRQYGQDRLDDDGAVEVYREHLFDWVMRGVDELSSKMRTPAQDDALRRAALDGTTYRMAMQWASERGQPVAALRIASLAPIIHHRGERRTAILECLEAAERLGPVDDLAAGEAWAAIGNIAFEQADPEASLKANKRASGHFRAAGRSRLAAWSQYLCVHSAWIAGELDEVDRFVAEAITNFRAEGDQMGLGYTLWVASLRSSDLDAASDMASEADELLRKAGVPMGIAHNVEGRGIIAYERGDVATAAEFVAEAVQLFASYENLGCTAHALEAAAVVLGDTGGSANSVAVELVTAANEFRALSGQGHRPWEIRARLGALEDHLTATSEEEDAMAREAGCAYDLSTAASVATRALLSLAGPHSGNGALRAGESP